MCQWAFSLLNEEGYFGRFLFLHQVRDGEVKGEEIDICFFYFFFKNKKCNFSDSTSQPLPL